MINKWIGVGNLGKDPEYETKGDTKWVKFSVATTTGFGEKKRTDWHAVTAFGKTAEACHLYLKKGSKVYVEGRYEQNTFEKKDGSKGYSSQVIADAVRFMDSKTEKTVSDSSTSDVTDSDIPF